MTLTMRVATIKMLCPVSRPKSYHADPSPPSKMKNTACYANDNPPGKKFPFPKKRIHIKGERIKIPFYDPFFLHFTISSVASTKRIRRIASSIKHEFEKKVKTRKSRALKDVNR